MSLFSKLILKVFGTKGQKNHSQFGDVIVSTTQEFNGLSDNPIKNILLSWLVSFPWAYFEALFINNSEWNHSLTNYFDDAEIENGEECALISQAFSLFLLSQLTTNSDEYKQYNFDDIEEWIKDNIKNSTSLLSKLRSFRSHLIDCSPDDWYLEYIYEIFGAVYSKAHLSSIVDHIRIDSQLRLFLMNVSLEMIKATKNATISDT